MNAIFASIIIVAGILGSVDNVQKLFRRKHTSFRALPLRQKVINLLLFFIIVYAVTLLMHRAIAYFLPEAHTFAWIGAAVIGLLMSLRPFLESDQR